MPILEKARELAALIAESPELVAVRVAEETMANDNAAQSIIQEFQQKQTTIQQAYMKGEELSDSQKQEVEKLQEKMRAHPLIAKYFDAQEKFEKVLHSVNHIMTKAITGEEAESGGCGCGSDHGSGHDDCCSSCDSCG